MGQRPPDTMQWFRKGDIQSSIRSIEQLFGTNVFSRGAPMPLLNAAVTHLLIMLNDLLQKAKVDGARITLSNDIAVRPGMADVTDLVRDMRNAACHIPSGLRELGGGRLSFNVIFGQAPNAIQIGDIVIGCDYADDIAVNYGGMRFYLVRHALAAFREVKERYADILN